jgi:hypothetical protein
MLPDILIVRDGAGYHLLHGHLHLAVMIQDSARVAVEVKGQGTVQVVKSLHGLLVEAEGDQLPLLVY